MIAYTPSELNTKLLYYRSLPEKARRHFLAIECQRLGWGAKSYLALVYGCSRNTIVRGMAELLNSEFPFDYTVQRKAGGGRKKKNIQ